MKNLGILICVIVSSLKMYSQSASIQGLILEDQDTASFIIVQLVNQNTGDTFSDQTGFNGRYNIENLPEGNYNLYTSRAHLVQHIDGEEIIILNNDSLVFNINLKKCHPDYPLKPCPTNGHTNNVVRIAYNYLVVNRTFKNARYKKKYLKKIRKQGYITEFFEDTEVLVKMNQDSLHRELNKTGLCDNLFFCKRHKVVFE